MQLTLAEAFAVVFVSLLFILMITGSIAICCKIIEGKRQNQQHQSSIQANANQLSGVNENGQNNSDAAAVKTSVKQRNNEQIILAPIIENEFDKNKPQQIVTKQWPPAVAAVTDDVNVEKIGGIVIVHTMPKTENIPPKKFGPIIKYHPLHPENDQTNLSPKIEHYPSSEGTVVQEFDGVRYSSASEVGSSVSTAVFQHGNNKNVDNLHKTTEFESSILPNEMQSNMEKCSSVIQTSNNDDNIRNEMEKKHQIDGNDQK